MRCHIRVGILHSSLTGKFPKDKLDAKRLILRNFLLKNRFWSKVKKTKICWLWQAGTFKSRRGYGQFYVDGKSVRTHRFSWEIHYGPIPENFHVLHKCDTPTCVNPEHLFLGTPKDNMQDCLKKGRKTAPNTSGPGECNGHAKLIWSKIRKIRALYKTGNFTQSELAKKFKVSVGHISLIVNNKTWCE